MKRPREERRRHPRYVVDLDIAVRLPDDDALVTARVRDLCLGGVCLVGLTGGHASGLAPGSSLDLQLMLPGATTALHLAGQVVRHTPDGLGVLFVSPPPAALRALRDFADRLRGAARSPEPPPAAGAADSRRAAAILERITRLRGNELFDAWLQAAEDAIWNEAEHAASDSQGRQLRDEGLRLGQLRGDAASEAFCRLLADDSLAGPLSQPPTGDDSELELVDHDSFETWLEMSGLTSFLEDDLAEPLRILRSQVDRGFASTDRLTLQPARLVGAFAAWAHQQGLSTAAQRLSIRAARTVLPRLLGSYYRDLSRALEEAGLRPSGQESVRQRVAAALSQAQRAPRPDVPKPAAEPERSAAGGVSIKGGAAHKGLASGNELTLEAAAELLLALPADALLAAGGATGQTGRSLKQQALGLLSQLAPEVQGQSLSPVLRERIEATDRVVSHLAGTTQGLPRVQHWAEQLTQRILTAALVDPEFFRQPGHPLMALLGKLEHLAMFLPNKATPGSTGLSAQIDGLLADALTLDTRDPARYQPILDRLQALERQHSERFRQEAARTIERLEGQERRDHARRQVQLELAERFGGQQMHRTVMEVIDTAWATLLELRYLRDGPDSADLQAAWQVLASLHGLCPCSECEPAAEVDLSSLEDALRAGFAYTGLDPYRTRATMEQVRETVRRCRSGLALDDEFSAYQPPLPEADDAGVLDNIPADMAQALATQVDAAQLGAVLRRRGKQGGEQPMQLVWRSQDGSAFAFLNAADGQSCRYGRANLIAGLYEGTLRLQPVHAEGLVDRVLDATLGEMQEHVRYHETPDVLTGLHNPVQFTGRVTELLRSHAMGRSWLLGFVDIDHFEAIRSTCGYQVGERLLRDVTAMLGEAFPDDSYLAFMGGSRFGFILPSSDEATGIALSERLRGRMAAHPLRWRDHDYPVTASMGLVNVQLGSGDPDALLSSVSIACAAAREEGGDRLVVFREEDDAITRQRDGLHWLSAVEEVIQAQRIRLRVQKIAPLRTDAGLPHHHEVLMRVHDADGQELDLERFIATAEAFKLMAQVDRLVIGQVLDWARDNHARFNQLGALAINLSGRSLSDPQLLDYIRERLAASGLPPAAVSFEVTETAAIASMERAVAILQGIREIGCRVALDDFGTGMASYSYLKSLPVDYVKIDGSFIRDMLTNPHDQAIVKSITEIAHFMGIKTIAEHVESADVASRLGEIGVDYVQGYWVHRPAYLQDMSDQSENSFRLR